MEVIGIVLLILFLHGLILIGLVVSWVRISLLKKKVLDDEKRLLQLSQEVSRLKQQATGSNKPAQQPSTESMGNETEHTKSETGSVASKDNLPVQVMTWQKPVEKPAATKEQEHEKVTAYQAAVKPLTETNSKQPVIKKKELPDFLSVESIISKLGIFLLLLGIGYIFSWAYDQDYPVIALTVGLILGCILMYLSLRVEKKGRLILSQVLLGGSIATYYITIYSIYQGFQLIPDLAAFILMCVITGLAFFISMAKNTSSMSIIGVLGALLTPFIIPVEGLGLFGMGLYVVILSAGSMLVYFYKKWRSLQICTVVGITIVTSIFVSYGGFSQLEKFQLSILLLIIMIILNGTDYFMYYVKRASSQNQLVSYLLFSTLPLISSIQFHLFMDFETLTVFLIYAVANIAYIGLFVLFYRRGDEVVSNILLSLASLFAFYSVVVIFEKEIELLTLFAIGTMMYLISNQLKHKYLRLLGHILYIISGVIALTGLMASVVNNQATIDELVLRLAIVILIVLGSLLNQGFAKKAIGIFGLEIYFLLAVLIYVNDNLKVSSMAPYLVLTYGLMVLLLYGINHFLKILPSLSLVIVTGVVFFAKVIVLSDVLIGRDIELFEVSIFGAYGLMTYLIGHFIYKDKSVFRSLFKISSYSLVGMTLLVELSDYYNVLSYGLVLFMVLVYLIQSFEPDRKVRSFKVTLRVYKVIFGVLVSMVILFANHNEPFNLLLFVVNILLLTMIFIELKEFAKGKLLIWIAALNALAYMIMIYKSFNETFSSGGLVTVLWAVYAVTLLVISVIRSNKSLVNFSLGMIILVALKLILIDLSTLDTVWKIVVSMLFGGVLLALSYLLQPIIAKNSEG